MSIASYRGYCLPFGRHSKLINFQTIWTLAHQQKVCMAPILTNSSILDASKYSQHNPLDIWAAYSCTENQKRKRMAFFVNFYIFLVISSNPPKFHRHFCSNRYHFIFQRNIHCYFCEKVVFRWLIKVQILNIKSDLMTQI